MYLNFSAVCQQNQKLRALFKPARKKNLMMRCTLLVHFFFSLIKVLKEYFLTSKNIYKSDFPSCLSAKFKKFLEILYQSGETQIWHLIIFLGAFFGGLAPIIHTVTFLNWGKLSKKLYDKPEFSWNVIT